MYKKSYQMGWTKCRIVSSAEEIIKQLRGDTFRITGEDACRMNFYQQRGHPFEYLLNCKTLLNKSIILGRKVADLKFPQITHM